VRARLPGRATALLLIVLGAAAVGWLIGGAADPEPVRPAPTRAVAGLDAAQVSVSGSWRRWTGPPVIDGLDAARTAMFEPLPGLPASAVLTVAPARDATLVPAAFKAALKQPPSKPARTTLAGLRAWRYGELATARGADLMDVTLVPTSAGVLALACLRPPSLSAVVEDCADGVERVVLDDARPIAPGPDVAMLQRLPRALADLDTTRVRARRALQQASYPRGQARSAAALSAVHKRTARQLEPFASLGGDSAPLVVALEQLGAAYDKLRLAAAARRPPQYAAAAGIVRAREARLASALSRLSPRLLSGLG
jgi:hypothetical protein